MKKFTFAKANASKLARLPLYALIALVALVFPRNRDLWVFGRKTGVGEGPLRLWQIARQDYPQLRLVWIAQDQAQYEEATQSGLEVYLKSSWRARWLTLRAGVGIVTHGFGDLCRPFVPGMYLVQLWHGAPLKRIHLDAPNAQLTGAQGLRGKIGAWVVACMFRASAAMIHCLPSPSPLVSARFKSAFAWRDLSRIRLTGDPRCDVLLEGSPTARKLQALKRLSEVWELPVLPQKLVLFAPTWRDGDADPTLPSAEAMRALECVLARHNAWLVVRSHPWGNAAVEKDGVAGPRIRFLSTPMLHDINSVLSAFDVLITDYSAIAMDYSLLQRPIVFFAPDLDTYHRTRGLYESYDTFTGGQWSADWDGVTNQLAAWLRSDEKTIAEENSGARLARRYHTHIDANSAHRLLHEIAIDMDLPRPRSLIAPIEVLHVSGCLGGVETYLHLLAAHNDSGKMRLSFVLPESCALDDYASTQGMPVHLVAMKRPISVWSDLKAGFALRRIVRRAAPDVVHLHSSKAGLIGRLACLGLGHKVVYTPHAYFFLGKRGVKRRIFLAAERVLDRLARSITLGTSPSEEARAIDDIGCPPERVAHILNSVDLDRMRERPPVRRGNHIVLVARVSQQKNIPMYLEVVRQLRETGRTPCYLIGVGHYEDDRRQLLHMLHAAGLSQQDLVVVEWMPRADLMHLLADAAVVVLTSHYESFGYVLAEANGMGVPVVGTDVDGIRDVIRDGHNGYLVPANDAKAMAACVRKLLDHAEVWSAMSIAAYQEARQRFDIRKSMPQFEAFYTRQVRGR